MTKLVSLTTLFTFHRPRSRLSIPSYHVAATYDYLHNEPQGTSFG